MEKPDANGWLSITTLPESEIKDGWPVRKLVLVVSKEFGIRTGTVFNWRGRIGGNVGSFSGDAFADWGVTHWQPLPGLPESYK